MYTTSISTIGVDEFFHTGQTALEFQNENVYICEIIQIYMNFSLTLKFSITTGPLHLFTDSSIPQPFLFAYSKLGKTDHY